MGNCIIIEINILFPKIMRMKKEGRSPVAHQTFNILFGR